MPAKIVYERLLWFHNFVKAENYSHCSLRNELGDFALSWICSVKPSLEGMSPKFSSDAIKKYIRKNGENLPIQLNLLSGWTRYVIDCVLALVLIEKEEDWILIFEKQLDRINRFTGIERPSAEGTSPQAKKIPSIL
jgi:hypothetical protein